MTSPVRDDATRTVADVLLLDEYSRTSKLAALFLVMLPFAGLSMFAFEAHPVTSRLFASALAASFFGTVILYLMTRSPDTFRLWTVVIVVALQALTIVAATAYFGLYSPAAVVAVLVTLFAALGNYPVLGITIWLISATGRLALLALFTIGGISDPGIVVADRVTHEQMIAAELLVQAIIAISFAGGRLARKATVANITALAEEVHAGARRELEVANRLQTSILPRELDTCGFAVAAHMIPASDVGGDYYDVRPTRDGCWIGIGDVSGHGFTAGMIMLIAQTSMATLADDARGVVDVLEGVNRTLYSSVAERLRTRDFVTCSLLRLWQNGCVHVAGRHEPVIVVRAATGTCDVIDPEGLWLGVRPSVAAHTIPIELTLAPGDTIVLHTDGVTEAIGADGRRFGFERLRSAALATMQLPCAESLAAIEREVLRFATRHDDDITLLVIRYVGPPPPS